MAESEANDFEITIKSLELVFETSSPLQLRNGLFGVAFQVRMVSGSVKAKNKTSQESIPLSGSTFGAGTGRLEQTGDTILLSVPNLAQSFSIFARNNQSFPLRLELGFVTNLFASIDLTKGRNIRSNPSLEPSARSASRDQSSETSEDNLGLSRSEERRVGKECRSRWSPYH